MSTPTFRSRHFHIVDHSGEVFAAAQFMYRGYQISFSTIGRDKGGCQIPVEVFEGPNFIRTVNKDGFHTVEDAIEYIDSTVFIDSIKD